MPFACVHPFEGRGLEQRRAVAEAITQQPADTRPPESVDIVFDDVKRSDRACAGRLASDPPKA